MDISDVIFGLPLIIVAPVVSSVMMGGIIYFMVRKDLSTSWKGKARHIMVMSFGMFLMSFMMTQTAVQIDGSKNEAEATSQH